jgi:hypothetical protein
VGVKTGLCFILLTLEEFGFTGDGSEGARCHRAVELLGLPVPLSSNITVVLICSLERQKILLFRLLR